MALPTGSRVMRFGSRWEAPARHSRAGTAGFDASITCLERTGTQTRATPQSVVDPLEGRSGDCAVSPALGLAAAAAFLLGLDHLLGEWTNRTDRVGQCAPAGYHFFPENGPFINMHLAAKGEGLT